MLINLDYGRHGLMVDIPDDAVVIEPAHQPGLQDEHAAFREAVRAPIHAPRLAEVAHPTDRVCIVIADGTRPSPSERLVPWILAELTHVPRDRFVILVGTGTHRPNTPSELEAMLGSDVLASVEVINHNAFERSELVHLGQLTDGGPVWLNRRWVEADVRIVTGFIEPHLFAGFSGGAKGICPGVAGFDTIMHLHRASLIADPRATWAILEDNPVQQGIREAVAMAPPHFLVNVALNRARQITGIYAGDYLHAHAVGCREVADVVLRSVDGPFDVVVTTNSGYPLDQNLYQSVKGVSAAARIVREGGAILLVSECADGLPDHGNYRQILEMRETPQALLEMVQSPGFRMQDQWEVQVQAAIQVWADVYVYSTLRPDQVQAAKLIPVTDVQAAIEDLRQRYGHRLAVLPQGPLTVPQNAD